MSKSNSIEKRLSIPWSQRIPISAILILLLFLIFARTGESMHGQMTKVGESLWDNYFAMRADPVKPDCDPNFDVQARLDELEAQSSGGDDDFDLLMESSFDREASQKSLERQKALCASEFAEYESVAAGITPSVKTFRTVEHHLANASIFATAQQQMFLVFVLFVAALVTTMQRHHIAFRPIESVLDHHVSTSLQLLANGALAFSAWNFRSVAMNSSIESGNPYLVTALAVGSTALAALSLYQWLRIPKNLSRGGSPIHALLSVPIYTMVMLLFAAIVYLFQGHTSGLAIYFSAFFENSGTYLDVALYLWAGMLLKQTQLGERVFSLFTPWKLPPEILAFVAVVVMAVPTAYTGASSIIILAMGVVVYRELRKVGTRRQLALATTAMSGSSGIVLKPCLLVVIISILNKEVVTDDLFYWGLRVFLLTVAVFFVYALITRKDPIKVAHPRKALPESLANAKFLIPYVVVFGVIMLAYALLLDAYMDQFSAPIILPILIIGVIFYERVFSKAEPLYDDPERMDNSVRYSLVKSMSDACVHIGALLMLMATFMVMTGLGGKMVSATFLANFDSTWAVMGCLVIMFVLIGMFMESMAAVGMVSIMIAPIAYQQGINPIHFWMTCLVALELGYLSPPVALSHIFTRQVVGEKEVALSKLEGDTFYYRYERFLLPLMVMATTLMLVAFVPLAYNAMMK